MVDLIIGCIDKWVKSKCDIATPQNLFSGPKENNWKKNQRSRFRKTPLLGPKTTLSPQGPPQKTKLPKMGDRVIIWGILVRVNFLYNFLKFLQFFPDLLDTRGPLGGPVGPRGGPPKGVFHLGTFQQ